MSKNLPQTTFTFCIACHRWHEEPREKGEKMPALSVEMQEAYAKCCQEAYLSAGVTGLRDHLAEDAPAQTRDLYVDKEEKA